MIAKFDSYRKFETPLLYVCNPGCVFRNGMLTNTSGILVDTSDIEIIPTFNAPSVLNFRCYKVKREDADENAHMMRLYRSLRNRRLIYADGIGFFVITECTDGYEEKVAYKDVTAESCEVELRTKNLPYIENGTYKFITREAGNPGLIEKLMASMPLWKLGNVDVTVANRYRTFEDVDYAKNILAFMLDDVQNAYECIVVFDILNRIVNIYDRGNYVHETDIHITKDDFINSLDITESSDDLYTALRVEGDANLNINAINPIGTGVIYNFDYYLDWMSDSLGEKVAAWQNLVKSYEDSYYNLQLGRYANLTSLSNLNAERNKLNTQLTMYTRCRENIVASASDADIAAYNAVIVQMGGIPIPTDEKYLWVMYADDSIGTGITATPYGKDYIGLAYGKTTQIASNKPEDYQWFTFRNGETFPRTVDGETKYTWIVFADSIISGMSDNPNNKAYIGVSIDKDSSTKSADYGDYSWSLIENGGIGLNETLATILSLIEGVEAEIAELDTQIEAVNALISDQDTQVSLIHNAVAMDQYFTTDELDELSNYIVEGSYTDEYVTVTANMTYADRFTQMKILYDRAVDQLGRSAFPTQEFTLDVENFIFIKEFERWSDQLETGCLINVEVDDNDVAALFLTSFEVNYEDKSLSMTFGNRYNRFDPKALFDQVLGNISKTSNTLSYITNTIYPIKNGELNEMKEALETSRTLTKNDVLSSNNEQVIIDDTGYTGRRKLQDGTVDPKQIKINGRNIVFTDDAWETCKTAIGEIILSGGASAYGVNAEVLLGNIIMGNELHIINAQGQDMFTVTGENILARVGDEFAKKEDTITGVDVMYCRANSSLQCDETTITVGWSTTAPAWVNGEYIWQKTVTTYDAGDPTESEPTCLTGAAGESAYTIMLTNNNYTFAASENAALVANVDCDVIAYRGSTRVVASIGDITGAPLGMNVTVSGSGTTAPKFNVSVTGSMVTKNGTLNVPVTVDGKTFNMTFSYSLALKGGSGNDAYSYSLIVSHAAIVRAPDGTYNPTAIKLMSKSNRGVSSISTYLGRFKIETTQNNSTWTTVYTSAENESDITYNIPSDITAIRCSLYQSGGTTKLLDQQVIPVVLDGTNGHNGEDAYTVILTNENHTFAGGVDAAIASNVECGVIAYKGATQVTATIGTITGAPAGMSTLISNNGTTTAKFNVAVTTDMKTQNGTLNVPVTVDGKTFNMVFTYSLALDGVGVSDTIVKYAVSEDGSTPPDEAEWDDDIPSPIPEGQYLWTRTEITYTNNSTSTSYSVSRNGISGGDAYTIVLSNENHTFAGGTSAALAANTDCSVIAYKGATQVAATIGTITGMPAGMTVTTDNESTPVKFNVAVTTSMKTKSGTLNVPVTVDGRTFNKSFSYSLAIKGTDVTTYGINVSNAVVVLLPEGTYSPAEITLTSKSYKGTGTIANYSGRFKIETTNDNSTWTSVYTSAANENTKIFTVPSNIAAIRCSLYKAGGTTTLFDQQTVPIVSDGMPGVGIDTIIEEYCLSTSEEELTGEEIWSETPPVWVSGKYIWTRSHIYYDNNTDEVTDPVVSSTYNYLGASLDDCVTDININKTGIEQNTRYYQELYGQVARINAYIQTGVVNIDDNGKTSFGVKIGENLSVINAYIVSGSTELSSGWLSDADGGQALTPMEAIIYRVMSTGTYYGKTYRWDGTSYEEATSEGTLSSVFTSSELGFYDTGEKTAYFSNKNLNVRTVRTNKILLSNDVISDTSSSNWQIGIDNGFYLKWIGS